MHMFYTFFWYCHCWKFWLVNLYWIINYTFAVIYNSVKKVFVRECQNVKNVSFLLILLPWLPNKLWSLNELKQGLWCTTYLIHRINTWFINKWHRQKQRQVGEGSSPVVKALTEFIGSYLQQKIISSTIL